MLHEFAFPATEFLRFTLNASKLAAKPRPKPGDIQFLLVDELAFLRTWQSNLARNTSVGEAQELQPQIARIGEVLQRAYQGKLFPAFKLYIDKTVACYQIGAPEAKYWDWLTDIIVQMPFFNPKLYPLDKVHKQYHAWLWEVVADERERLDSDQLNRAALLYNFARFGRPRFPMKPGALLVEYTMAKEAFLSIH